MTGHQINSLVGDLVAMAQAMERLPQVEAELTTVRRELDDKAATIQRLELKLMERSNEINEHLARIRSLEVERDDAQFHALEADDRTQRALDFIKATFGNAGALIQALEPPAAPKPEPTAAEVPVQAVQSASEPRPLIENPIEQMPEVASAPSGEPSTGVSADTHNPPATEVPSTAPTSSPASEVAQPGEPDAFAASPMPSVTNEATVQTATDGSQTSSMSAEKPNGPYVGKRYSEVVASGQWPTREQWEAGGGTEENWFA
jgi:hypothetical protein